MPRHHIDNLIISPDAPGDLVCSRHVIDSLSKRGNTTVIVPKSLLGLLKGLFIEILSYEVMPRETLQFVKSRCSTQTSIFDLLCFRSSDDLCQSLEGHTIGVPDPNMYDREVLWNIGAEDETHYVVRLTRYLPEYETATTFDIDKWKQCHFSLVSPPSSKRLALAPGCGIENCSKRWPMESWIMVASWAIDSGMWPVWFLGPDEKDLVDKAKQIGGEIVSGNWQEVIINHAQCKFGISNDTVHLHIRAHMQVRTIGLFISTSSNHWGNYPDGVKCLNVEPFHSEKTVVSVLRSLSGWNL